MVDIKVPHLISAVVLTVVWIGTLVYLIYNINNYGFDPVYKMFLALFLFILLIPIALLLMQAFSKKEKSDDK